VKIVNILGLAILQTATVNTVLGQTSNSNSMSPAAGDTHFAKEAASGGMAEVKLGQLAQQNGASDAVKQFGKRMENDHSKANDQLKDIASKDNIVLPTDLNRKDQATYDRLSKLSGAAFDRAYAQDMVSDHENDVAAFKKESNNGQNPDVKNFAFQTLPTLQEHLRQAKGMANSVGATIAKPMQ
jgi:putative membrane protein